MTSGASARTCTSESELSRRQPAGTPPAIAQRLRDEVAKAVSAADAVALLDTQGMQPLATQPDEWRQYLKAELDRYTRIIKEANIKPE